MSIIEDNLEKFQKIIEHFQEEIGSLNIGRATPAILDGVTVESYGVKTPINQLASVSVPQPGSLIITPWDKNIIKEIEKALVAADLGLDIINESDKIRAVFPKMTEETRKKTAASLHQKMEQARIALRTARDQIKEEILEAEKNKEFGEDERYQLIEELDQKTGEFNKKIKELGEKKETEIMEV